ncbi:unnamed protein product [Closterium sp. NIES-54]
MCQRHYSDTAVPWSYNPIFPPSPLSFLFSSLSSIPSPSCSNPYSSCSPPPLFITCLQVLIRQASEYYQFFDPLLCPMKHFLPTHRYFNNLYAQIQWARANDQRAREIVAAANEFAR